MHRPLEFGVEFETGRIWNTVRSAISNSLQTSDYWSLSDLFLDGRPFSVAVEMIFTENEVVEMFVE